MFPRTIFHNEWYVCSTVVYHLVSFLFICIYIYASKNECFTIFLKSSTSICAESLHGLWVIHRIACRIHGCTIRQVAHGIAKERAGQRRSWNHPQKRDDSQHSPSFDQQEKTSRSPAGRMVPSTRHCNKMATLHNPHDKSRISPLHEKQDGFT